MENERYKIITEWIDSTQSAIETLRAWLQYLQAWQYHGGELYDGDFYEVFGWLRDERLDAWADRNSCDIDLLAAAVKGEELPEPPGDVLEAIFGKGVRDG